MGAVPEKEEAGAMLVSWAGAEIFRQNARKTKTIMRIKKGDWVALAWERENGAWGMEI